MKPAEFNDSYNITIYDPNIHSRRDAPIMHLSYNFLVGEYRHVNIAAVVVNCMT